MKWLKGIALLLISNLLFMVAINLIVSVVLPLFGITFGSRYGVASDLGWHLWIQWRVF